MGARVKEEVQRWGRSRITIRPGSSASSVSSRTGSRGSNRYVDHQVPRDSFSQSGSSAVPIVDGKRMRCFLHVKMVVSPGAGGWLSG